MFVELIVTALTPARDPAVIWSRINASSGDTTIVGPAPTARFAAVAAQYTALLPQPVASTTRTRALSTVSARTASACPSRGGVPGPAIASRTRASAASASAVVIGCIVAPNLRSGCDGAGGGLEDQAGGGDDVTPSALH